MAWVYLLFGLSGAAGLVYAVVWTRTLTLALGSTVVATTTVLGAFMAGLALGNVLGGRVLARGRHHPLTVYATLQGLIGLVGLVLPALLVHTEGLIAGLWRGFGTVSALAATVRVLLVFGLLVLPTACMGATLPVIAKFTVTGLSRVGRGAGALYAVSAFGAAAGAMAAGFVLIEGLGTWGASAVAAGLNGIAWLGAWTLSRRPRAPRRAEGPMAWRVASSEVSAAERGVVYAAIAASGLAALGYGVVWSRALVFMLGNSTYALSAMLATFLLGIALGSAAMRQFADRARALVRSLGVVEFALAFSALATVPIIWVLLNHSGVQAVISQQESWFRSVGLSALVACGVMVVPAALCGAAFPLASRIVTTAREEVPRALGDVALANTLGAIAGLLLTGFVLVPLLGLSWSVVALAGVNLAAGIACTLAAREALRSTVVAVGGSAALFVAVALLVPAGRALRAEFEEPSDRTLFYDEGLVATVKVYQKPDGKKTMIMDGRTIGGTEQGMDQKEKLLAHLPVLLAPRADKVLAIGLGSGITVGALMLYDEVQKVDVVEIVPGVVRGAAWFAAENHDVLHNPRVQIQIGDPIHYLLTSPVHYDLISSNAKLEPDTFSNAIFFSQEYYRRCRERLVPGGVLCQWVPYYLPEADFRMVLRTFTSVFPETTLWNFGSEILLLLGTKGPVPIDYGRLARRMREPAVGPDLAYLGFDTPVAFLSHFVAGPEGIARLAGTGPLNTWTHPVVGFRGPRASRRRPQGEIEASNLELVQTQAEPLKARLVNVSGDSTVRTVTVEELNRALEKRR